MPGTTAKGYPYPLGTELVSEGDNVLQQLAQAIDVQLGKVAAGAVPVTTTSSAAASLAVTFPVGRFTAAPICLAMAGATAIDTVRASCAGVTAAGCNLWLVRPNAGTNTVYYVAMQVP